MADGRPTAAGEDDLDAVRALLRRLTEVAPWWRGFWAPMPAREVEAFEAAHGVRLPDDHRRLLIEVGDRAPMPGRTRGGLIPLADATTATTASGFLGRLGEPFPHAGDAAVSLPWDDDADDYRGAPPLRGLLPIADGGCDVTYLLVATGPARGMVWAFAPSGDPELHPTGAALLPWYRGQLEAGLEPLARDAAERADLERRVAAADDDLDAAVRLGRDLLPVDEARAAALIERAWARGGDRADPALLRAVAELDLAQGRHDRLAALEAGDDRWLRCYAGISAAKAGRWRDARALLGAVDAFPVPMRALASGYLARALLEAGDAAGALALLRASPTSPGNHALLAELYRRDGQLDAAARAWRNARTGAGPDPSRVPRRPTLADRLAPALPTEVEIDAAVAELERALGRGA